jgi:GT2 family glycosyltransferase
MKISIVIPNYNGRHLLEKNLPFVYQAINNSRNNISDLVIVDNGSIDDSIDFLNKNYKGKFKLIKHLKNRGFSTAINIGVRSTHTDLVLLLNNDVAPESNFLESAQKLFDDPNVFAVSLHELGHGPSRALFNNGIIDIGSPKAETKKNELTFYVSGAAGLFRKNIWQELGGMDERLLSPFYWEDIDICYRALKRGYTTLWCSDGKVVHNHESTSSKLPKKYVARIKERNQLLMLWKNIHSKAFMSKHINYLIRRVFKTPGYLLIIFMAFLKFDRLIKARKKEIKESIVSDEAVFQKYQ